MRDDRHRSIVECQLIDEPIGVLSVVGGGAAEGLGDEQES